MLQLRNAFAAAALAVSVTALPATDAFAGQTMVTSDSAERFNFVMISSGDRNTSMNGSSADYERARSLRAGNGGLIYFRQDGAAYVIRDAAILARADAIMEPQRVLGAKQGALGARQGALGARQGDLGRAQSKLGAQMSDSTPRMMAALGRQQAALGRMQSDLGAQQAALGRQQADLGREQARLGQIANGQLRALVAEAMRKGLAQKVD